MKEAIVKPGPRVELIESKVPVPGPNQVVTRVIVSGSNPKDWKVPEWTGMEMNQGDDIAGLVHAVGSNVTEFKAGDRVAAFHEMRTPGGSYAEYALSWQHTTFHIPKSTSFEEAAALPLAAMTSAVGLYLRLGLPAPWTPATKPIPLVVYGGASAVGAYAIQLARRSNIHPIITVAGRGAQFVEGLIDRSKGDTIVDYRNGDNAVVKGIQDALMKAGADKLEYAFDAVSEKGSYQNLSKILAIPGGKITLVLPGKNYDEIPKGIEHSLTSVGCVHQDDQSKEFGYVYFRYIAKGLQDGWFKPHPQEAVKGGLNGLQGALQNLKDGKASAVKYVFCISDTEGVAKTA